MGVLPILQECPQSQNASEEEEDDKTQCRGCCSVLLKGNIWTGGALPVTKQAEETVTKGGRAHSSLRHWEANKLKDGNGDGQVKVRWNHIG